MRPWTLRSPDPFVVRDRDLRRWQAAFVDAVAIADLRARQRDACVGVVTAVRLVPGRALDVTVEDGTGRLVATWPGRASLPGLELGHGLHLNGTVFEEPDGTRRMLNPAWEPVAAPYR